MKTSGDWSSANTFNAHFREPVHGVVAPMSMLTLIQPAFTPGLSHLHSGVGGSHSGGRFFGKSLPPLVDSASTDSRSDTLCLMSMLLLNYGR